MKKDKQPNEIVRLSSKETKPSLPQHNAVTENGIPVLIKKRRQFGGLMCPPMGSVNVLPEHHSIKRD
ncbi:MAG: hypothetical protein AAGA53_11305 [Pseudomonadota bacterium]